MFQTTVKSGVCSECRTNWNALWVAGELDYDSWQSVKAGGCPECYERDSAWKRGCGAGEVTEDTAGFGCW